MRARAETRHWETRADRKVAGRRGAPAGTRAAAEELGGGGLGGSRGGSGWAGTREGRRGVGRGSP